MKLRPHGYGGQMNSMDLQPTYTHTVPAHVWSYCMYTARRIEDAQINKLTTGSKKHGGRVRRSVLKLLHDHNNGIREEFPRRRCCAGPAGGDVDQM